jgi:hypothetical protein
MGKVIVSNGRPGRTFAARGERISSRVHRRERLEAEYAALERAERETLEDFERMVTHLKRAVARQRQAEQELAFERRAHHVTAEALEAQQGQVRHLTDENRELRRRIKDAVDTLRQVAVRNRNQKAIAECDATLDALEAESRWAWLTRS